MAVAVSADERTVVNTGRASTIVPRVATLAVSLVGDEIAAYYNEVSTPLSLGDDPPVVATVETAFLG